MMRYISPPMTLDNIKAHIPYTIILTSENSSLVTILSIKTSRDKKSARVTYFSSSLSLISLTSAFVSAISFLMYSRSLDVLAAMVAAAEAASAALVAASVAASRALAMASVLTSAAFALACSATSKAFPAASEAVSFIYHRISSLTL